MADDYISRQAVMKEFSDFVRKSNNSDFAPTPTWNDAVSLVGSIPSAQPHWIPCSERLPEEDEDVLVCTEDGIIEKAYHTLKEWCEDEWEWFIFGTLGYSYALNDYEVIAWMPLPEPYGGENE